MQQLDISKYPDHEVRMTREAFTAKLRKICAKLEACSSQIVPCKDWLTGAKVSVAAKARGLWVFGSYARGALTCGDLDLLIQLDYAQTGPRPSTLTKAFVGAHPHVRIYHGTPEHNDTTLKLSDAVLIWEPGMDWAPAIARIEANSSAGRFTRVGDTLPFRAEQDGLSLDQRESLVSLHEGGILNWSFVPLSAIPQQLTPRKSNLGRCDEAWVLSRFGEQSAMKQKLAPVVLGFARQLAEKYCPGTFIEWDWNRNIRLGTIALQVGTLTLPTLALNSYERTAVAFIPALSTKGPNGFWLIERGPNHPMVKALADSHLWVLSDKEGGPAQVHYQSSSSIDGRATVECVALEVYSSQQEAQACSDMYYERDVEDDPEVCHKPPRRIEGPELLQALTRVDVLMPAGGDTIPLTYLGARYCIAENIEASIPTAAALAEKLKDLQSTSSIMDASAPT